jgi:hypothetical protein
MRLETCSWKMWRERDQHDLRVDSGRARQWLQGQRGHGNRARHAGDGQQQSR